MTVTATKLTVHMKAAKCNNMGMAYFDYNHSEKPCTLYFLVEMYKFYIAEKIQFSLTKHHGCDIFLN
jgi:hypothetical protein